MQLLDGPVLTMKEIHAVRWLSYFIALQTVYRSLDALFVYLEEVGTSGKDPKASALKKKEFNLFDHFYVMATNSFVATTYMLMDAMAPVTVLSQFFQTENIDIALVKVKLDLCIGDLQLVKSLQSPYLKQLEVDVQGSQYKEHQLTKTPAFDLFPDTDLLTAFSVLGMRPLSCLNETDQDTYGNTQIETLCNNYGSQQVAEWKDENENLVKNISDPLVDPKETATEWRKLKKVVIAEYYPRDSMPVLWRYIVKYHGQDYPNIIILAKLAITSAVHTAGCERGFSVQNQLLNKARNRLTVEKQDMLMRVELSSDLRTDIAEKALSVFKQKDRRFYSLQSTNTIS